MYAPWDRRHIITLKCWSGMFYIECGRDRSEYGGISWRSGPLIRNGCHEIGREMNELSVRLCRVVLVIQVEWAEQGVHREAMYIYCTSCCWLPLFCIGQWRTVALKKISGASRLMTNRHRKGNKYQATLGKYTQAGDWTQGHSSVELSSWTGAE